MGLSDRLREGGGAGGVFDHALAMRGGNESAVDEEPRSGDAPSSLPADTVVVGEAEQIAPGAAIRSLIKELQTQRHFGITTPSHLFSLMHRHLMVRRGAILVPHRDGGMVPIATVRLDATSSFRIRMLQEEVAWLGSGRTAVILDDARRERFVRRLSRADAKQTPRVVLLPFAHLRDIVAVLVVLDSPVLRMDPNVLDVIVGALSESAGKLLFDGRQRPMDHRRRSSVFRPEQTQSIVSRLNERAVAEGRAVQIIDIDVSPLIAAIMGAHPHLDQTRLMEDILDTAALLTEATHTVINPGVSRVRLLGLTQPNASAALIVHLFTVTLSSLFGAPAPESLSYTTPDADDLIRDT